MSGRNYLNDKIIEEYLRLISARNEEDSQLPSVHVCSVFLYKQLDKFGLEEGCRRTRNWIKEDITTKDMVFFPIHSREHWTLIVVEPGKKTVQYLDSLTSSRNFSSAPSVVKAFMELRHKEKGEDAEYRIKIRNDIPQQTNGVDCGVFVCQYAERISRKGLMDFQQEDMSKARKTMTVELLEGKLKPQEQVIQVQTEKREQKRRKKEKKENKRVGRKIQQEELKTEKEATGEGSKERINWPKANSKEWERLDEDLTTVLKAQSSSPESKATMHPVIIYTLCKERFGLKERKKKGKSSGPSKRQNKCSQLRKEINNLKEAFNNAELDEKDAIRELQDEKLKKLRLAKRAETLKRGRKIFTRNCNSFLSQPFDFARSVIAPKPKGNLKSSKEEVENHLRKAHERDKEESRERPVDMCECSDPDVEFDDEPPSWNEFNARLRKTRNKSAPGPNGVPYIVYKKCPGVAKLLWGYLKGLWRKNQISKEWRNAEGIFIPKENGAEDIGKFRTISLLNVE